MALSFSSTPTNTPLGFHGNHLLAFIYDFITHECLLKFTESHLLSAGIAGVSCHIQLCFLCGGLILFGTMSFKSSSMLHHVPEFPSFVMLGRCYVASASHAPLSLHPLLDTKPLLWALVKNVAMNSARHLHTFWFDVSFKPLFMQRSASPLIMYVVKPRGFQLVAVP